MTLFEEHDQLVKSCSKIPSSQCNVAYIDMVIPIISVNPFIFIAYTHGIKDGLRCNGGSFVSVGNCQHFINSLFYSTACLIGKKLGPELINRGCKAFVGFKEESEVFQNVSYRRTFMECDNFAIKMFISSGASIGESFDAMKNYYTTKIDRLMEFGEDPLFIGALTANRESLVFLGDRALKKEDLFSV